MLEVSCKQQNLPTHDTYDPPCQSWVGAEKASFIGTFGQGLGKPMCADQCEHSRTCAVACSAGRRTASACPREFSRFFGSNHQFHSFQVGFRNESCVEIGRENVVRGMFTPGGHVAVEDIHHTLSNFEFTFLSSVLSTSSLRAMTKGVVAHFVTPVIAFFTGLTEGETITELLSVCRVTARLSGNRQW